MSSRVEAFLGLAGALLALFTAFSGLIKISFLARIIVVGILALMAVCFITISLPKSPRDTAGMPRLNKNRKKQIVFKVFALIFASIAIIFLLWATVVFHNVLVSTNTLQGQGEELVLNAPHIPIEELTIALPAHASKQCRPFDPDAKNYAHVVLKDWDSVTPKIRISNFIHPQVFGVRCKSLIGLTTGSFAPSNLVLLPDASKKTKICIVIYGGLLYLASIIYAVRL